MKILLDDLDYILTLDKDHKLIEHGYLIINDSTIAEIGRTEDLRKKYPDRREFDIIIPGKHRLAMPGFVNTHQHVAEHLSRGLIPDNVATVPWVVEWAKPFYSSVTDEDEYWGALLACLDMIKTGTTCFIDQGVYNDGIKSADAMEKIGIRGIVGRHAADRPPKEIPSNWKDEWIEKQYFESAEKALGSLEHVVKTVNGRGNGRINAWICLEGKRMHTSDELYIGAKKLADRYSVGLNYHLASSLEEAQITQEETGKWPIEHAEEIGALGNNVLLAHVTAVKPNEIEILRKTGTSVAFCPGSALKLGKGATVIGVYPEMLEAGVNVSLGCDGTSAAGSTDMVRQLYLAAGLFKDGRRDPLMIPAEVAMQMATINGAQSLLLNKQIGSLEPGKKADLILFDLRRAEWLPVHDPIQSLVYSATGDSVNTVIIDGQVVMEDRKMKTVDENEIFDKATELSKDLRQRSNLIPQKKY